MLARKCCLSSGVLLFDSLLAVNRVLVLFEVGRLVAGTKRCHWLKSVVRSKLQGPKGSGWLGLPDEA